MLCPHCGATVGKDVQLCPRCKYSALPGSSKPQTAAKDASELYRIALPNCATVYLILGTLSFLILAKVFLAIHPAHDPWESSTLSLVAVLLLASLISWGIMWFELLQDNVFFAILSLLIPVATYAVVFAHPERAIRPFAIHVATLLGGLTLALHFIIQTGKDPYIFVNQMISLARLTNGI